MANHEEHYRFDRAVRRSALSPVGLLLLLVLLSASLLSVCSADVVYLTIMHTTSCYPCDLDNLNLRVIPSLRQRYELPVGFSSHFAGVGGIDCAAVALGAVAIERHFTLDRTMKGTDQAASLEPHGLETLVRYVRAVEKALGSPEKRVLECEEAVRAKTRAV